MISKYQECLARQYMRADGCEMEVCGNEDVRKVLRSIFLRVTKINSRFGGSGKKAELKMKKVGSFPE